MKRLLTLALIVFMIVSLAVMVWANDYPVDSAFIDQDVLDADYWDDPDTLELGGHGQPIQYVNGYGVGYSSLNDQVIYSKLDFGENGADKFIINFSFGADTSAILNVYIDEKSDKPAATLEIPNTGGWEEVWAQEFEADIDVPGGKHDVIVEFANDQSGSFTYIRFHEKEGTAAKDYPVDSAFIDQDVLDADYWDDPDTLELGGHGQPIQYVNGYGVGYSSLNDQVIYSKLDFGENGADKFIINFSFGADTSAILNVYIDEKSDKPAATLEIPNTGGWEEVWAQEFEADIDVPGGKHDVIVEFANDQSGSFTYIRFNEKAEASAPAVEKSISMPKTEFTVGEAVLVTASGEGKDWVGLYKEGDVPGGPASTAWYYVTEHNGEEYAITSDLPAGNYTMGLYLNDGYDLFGEAIPFTVVAEEVPAADSKGLASVEEAADGKNIITGYEFVSGTNGNGGEGPENLWDGNTATKFCTGEFPIESMAKLDGVYDITGFTMATANDNADWNGRSPSAWTISVSADGENWNELASGDDSFFEETNFTYYVGEGTASGVSYVKFNAEGAPSGCFQVSEVTLFGDKAVSVDEFLEKKEEAPNTFDFGIIAAVAAIISLGGFAVSKKRK